MDASSSDHQLTIDIKSIHSLSDEGTSDDGDESRMMSPSRKAAKEARTQLMNARLTPELHSPIRFPISPPKSPIKSPLKASPARRLHSNPADFKFSDDENSDHGHETRLLSPSRILMTETTEVRSPQPSPDRSVQNPMNLLR